MKRIEKGDVFYHPTNAELLNELFCRQFKAYMKASYMLDDGTMLWMARLDGKVRAGWRNFWQNKKIVEEYVGGYPYPDNYSLGFDVQRRAVFEKCDWGKYFVFHGVFRLEQGSTLKKRILELDSDQILL